MNRIIRNVIKCKTCGDIIESCFTHDIKYCSCGAVGIDGGHEYCRRIWRTGDADEAFEELTEFCNQKDE